MKEQNIKIQLEQIALVIESEINREENVDRSVRLQDAKEYLRRAWHCVDGSTFQANDTDCERQQFLVDIGRAVVRHAHNCV